MVITLPASVRMCLHTIQKIAMNTGVQSRTHEVKNGGSDTYDGDEPKRPSRPGAALNKLSH